MRLRVFEIVTLSIAAAGAAIVGRAEAQTLKAEYTFNNNFSSNVAGAPALIAVDPTGTSSFGTMNVLGQSRRVYSFNGAASPPTQQGGLSFDNTAGLIGSNNYSVSSAAARANGRPATPRYSGCGMAFSKTRLFARSMPIHFSALAGTPDAGTTILLLGVGILGIAILRRFVFRRARSEALTAPPENAIRDLKIEPAPPARRRAFRGWLIACLTTADATQSLWHPHWTRAAYPTTIRGRKMPDHTLTGNIQSHTHFESQILGNRRDVLVYLPPGYRRATTRRFPVLYLHDGQNVFDAATAFGGMEWGVDETAQRLVQQKLIEPVIIVAVANAGENRIHEYTPTRGRIDEAKRKRSKGLLRKYGMFLVEELKPFIDARYRTLAAPQYTGLAGSSLGGLATLSLGLWFPNVFRRLAVMSPSIWWDDCVLLKMIEQLDEETRPPLKIWLDTGTSEPGWERARTLRDGLVEKGWRLYDDLQYFEDEGASHTEAAWAHRIDAALRFLYPPPPPILPITTRRRVRTAVVRRPVFA